MNNITIIGHVGGDPETRVTPSGQKVTSFSVAVNVGRKGQEDTIWYRVSVWGDQFGPMMQWIKKGSALIVNGRLSAPRIYQDRNGQPAVSLEITAYNLEFPRLGRQEREGTGAEGGYGQSSMGTQSGQAAAPSPAPMSQSSGFDGGSSFGAAAPVGAGGDSAGISNDDLPF